MVVHMCVGHKSGFIVNTNRLLHQWSLNQDDLAEQ